MKNLAFHNLLTYLLTYMKYDYTTNSHYLTSTFIFRRVGSILYVLNSLGVKGHYAPGQSCPPEVPVSLGVLRMPVTSPLAVQQPITQLGAQQPHPEASTHTTGYYEPNNTPRKCAFLPCGQLNFGSAVTPQNEKVEVRTFHSSSSRSLSGKLGQETQYLASILTNNFVQCICCNLNCAQGKRSLPSR